MVLAVGTAFAAVGYTTLVVTVGQAIDTPDRAASGCPCSATALVALAFQPLRRSVVRLANRWPTARGPSPTRRWPTSAAAWPRPRRPETLLPAVAEAAGRAVSAAGAVATPRRARRRRVSGTWGARRRRWHRRARRSRSARGARDSGTIAVSIPERTPTAARPTPRLLTAIADQAAVAFRNAALEASWPTTWPSSTAPRGSSPSPGSRIIEADDAARRTLEEAISREVLPHLVALPDELARCSRRPSRSGRPRTASTARGRHQRRARGAARADPGRVPDPAGPVGHRAGAPVAPRPHGLASTLHVDASAAGRRFSPRVEAAVYFCCVEASRSASDLASLELSVTDDDLVLEVTGVSAGSVDLQAIGDRVEAVGGSVTAERRP